jgi:hypothetical protein
MLRELGESVSRVLGQRRDTPDNEKWSVPLVVTNNCTFATIMAIDAIPLLWHVTPYEGGARIP